VGHKFSTGVSDCGGPGSSPGLVKWDLWWTKWRWGRFSLNTSVSPANIHSTNLSMIIITRGRYTRPFGGRRAEWTQLGLHPPLCELKKCPLGSSKITCCTTAVYRNTRRVFETRVVYRNENVVYQILIRWPDLFNKVIKLSISAPFKVTGYNRQIRN
jgi:hypothetical protein